MKKSGSLNTFSTVAITGKPRKESAIQTHRNLIKWLQAQERAVFIDEVLQPQLPDLDPSLFGSLQSIAEKADLAIVIGGDGNMLGTARRLARSGIPVTGINRGNLGFLTDLNPDSFEDKLLEILNGEFIQEYRFLLETSVYKKGELVEQNMAFNEVVLHPEQVAHMIEFDVYINDSFAFSQRSDGLIIATPTGSTAYSLSAGGPVLAPTLDAITLVPMFPHSFAGRPLVINNTNKIKLKVTSSSSPSIKVSCDSHVALPVDKDCDIFIEKSEHLLNLIHPNSYDYYHILRNKLGWSHKLF